MPARRSATVTVAVGLLLLAGPSCGARSVDKVEASAWARDVCTSTGGWVDALQAAAPDTREIGTDLVKGRAALVRFLDRVTRLTGTYVREVRDAGIPDVEEGVPVAKEFEVALRDVRIAFERTRREAQGLPVDDPEAFARRTEQLSASLNRAGESVRTSLSEVQDRHPAAGRRLRTAFEQPACENIAS